MNKNELVTCIRKSDGKKKWLIASLAYNENYMNKHGLQRIEPAPLTTEKIEPTIKVPVEAVETPTTVKIKAQPKTKAQAQATPQPQQPITNDIDPFENINK